MIVHGISMFALFTKINNTFNPNQIAPHIRHQTRIKKFQL